MTFLKVLVGFLIGLVFAGGVFYYTMGGFKSVEVTKSTFPSTEIFYSIHRGPYENLSVSWTQFIEKIKRAGVDDCDAVGIYLDPPSTDPEKLRSIIGCKMDGLPVDKKEDIISQFSTFTMPQAEVYAGKFPYVNFFSFWLAPMKVYPKMQNLIATNIIKPSVSIETYGFEKGRSQINILMPTDRSREDYSALVQAFEPRQEVYPSNEGVDTPPIQVDDQDQGQLDNTD